MMDLHPVDILIHAINIVVLFILLRLILWRPVLKYLTAREQKVRSELEDAERSRAEADALKAEYAKKMDTIEAQGRDILRQSQMKAEEEAQDIIKDARVKAEEFMSDAHDKISAEKSRAVIAARHEIAQLATDMAARILKREVSADDNMLAVEDFFSETR